MGTHFYRPNQGHGLPHDPLNAIVGPRPIGWIGTLSPTGVRNLAPYSFFNVFNYSPPLLAFSTLGRKHSTANAARTGEFTWNLVTRDLAESMNLTSTSADVDEFELAGLESAPSVEIGAPRVAAARVTFECRLTQQLELESLSGPTGAWLTVGEVVAVHIDEDLLDDGVYRADEAGHVLRGGGPTAYYAVDPSSRFDLRRPGS